MATDTITGEVKRRSTWTMFMGLLIAALGLVAGPCVQAQDEQENARRCSLQTLKGSYGTLFTGHVRDFPDPGQNPIVIEARDTYDGAGHFTETGASMLSGTTSFQGRSTGTYKVNPNCSGSQELPGVASTKFQIVKHGTEILGILTTRSYTVSFHSEKQ
jgi:hypothetical protein